MSIADGLAWRFVALGGATAGLAVSPAIDAPPGGSLTLAALLCILPLLAVRAARRRSSAWQVAWLVTLCAVAVLTGLAIGDRRLDAIDSGALRAPEGTPAVVRGFIDAVPRRSDGEVSVRVATPDGRLLVVAPEPVPELPLGHGVRAEGPLREPEEWEAGYLARQGVVTVLNARRLELTATRRDGLPSLFDGLRERAENGLQQGTPEPEAALLRGFVLGEDDRIDPAIRRDFQRSGLAHVLAVSGQNVVLLALLATPVLALVGVPLRSRLVAILVLIAVYVPVAGAGPSIQRAGVMGAAATIATLAGRPRSRWYVVLLAALATLAINPRASADVGWQLSFAAVIGILLWAPALRDALVPAGASAWRRSLAEAAAVTVTATLATAPLMAHHFESVSLASIPANLLALPAVAPVMWLGMLIGAVAQVPWIPVEPLTWLAGLLAAYVAAVAHWFAAPDWALAPVKLAGAPGVAAAYAVLAGGMWVASTWLRRRRCLGVARSRVGATRATRRSPRLSIAIGAAGAAAVAVVAAASGGGAAHSAAGLRLAALDVGQGDSILLDPDPGEPILVDTGPPGSDVAGKLADMDIGSLAAVVITHDQADHAGGLPELLSAVDVDSLLYSDLGRQRLTMARADGVEANRVVEGSTIRSGHLRLDVLWPSRSLVDGPTPGDPNATSLVARASWHRFDALLTGDAEAELVPVDPGPVDVLKVAHHGSEDAGLGRLLDRTSPRLALISVGADNPYGHPAPETLATLADHGVRVLRTDLAGDVILDVRRRAAMVSTGSPG